MADSQPKRAPNPFKGKTLLVLLAIVVVSAIFGVLYAKSVVNRLTDAQPATLPTVKLSEIQMFQLHDRVDTFRDDVKDGDATPPLALSADELNALIETDSDFAALKNHLFVTIKGSELGAQISFPAETLGLAQLRGRFVNATGVFDVGLTNNELNVMAESLSVKGEPLPTHFMRQIWGRNLAEKLNQDPRMVAGLRKLKAIEVKDGKLVVTPKKH
jgi:hypothetical protein